MKTAVSRSLEKRLGFRLLLATVLLTASVASAHHVSAQTVPRMAPAGAPVNIPFQRTLPSFGHPIPPVPPGPVAENEFHTGSLICAPAKTRCHVSGTEILSQVDPKVETWLRGYVANRYSKKGQPVVWSESQFGIPPTPKSAQQFAADIEGVGCYVTTITMMENAALANLPPTAQLADRTKFFASLPTHGGVAPPEASGPSALDLAKRRLLWQYERWADKLQPNALHPDQPSQPDFLELGEFVNGIPNASYNEFNAPAPAQISDNALIDLMKAGHYLGFAYTRWTVGKKPGTDPMVKFTLSSQHKVAVDGFDKAQKYPITIGDVGNGLSYRVRIARLGDLKFKLNGISGTPPFPVSYGQLGPNRLVVIYENKHDDVVAEGEQVLMLDTVMDMVVPTRWSV